MFPRTTSYTMEGFTGFISIEFVIFHKIVANANTSHLRSPSFHIYDSYDMCFVFVEYAFANDKESFAFREATQHKKNENNIYTREVEKPDSGRKRQTTTNQTVCCFCIINCETCFSTFRYGIWAMALCGYAAMA